ncbi:UvrD-helicase domain-containing protein [Halobacterium litoreum]|uniref:DNA 3'-5' helicase n=1 Tax=Halobacterium litoreum TaxID=2039234 RepID=A0ABD5NI68_9EURY|nr:ATP-dependent DNA helicase [Halobacterium litoreum]UHH12169.1 DEAD/DEAH box helicase [Halobacterium litoreum]
MTEPSPNPEQQYLIDHIDGLYRVDAGAGTGKTFTVTRRYARIVDQDGVEPDDVLLATFTDNAASEMKDRIVSHSDYGMRALADAPIQTFHSLCHDLLEEHGHDAPRHLGLDDHITGTTRLVENDVGEEALFREFANQFTDAHPEYHDTLRAVDDPVELLELIRQLAAKGVFPEADGWYRDGEEHLDGDFDAFQDIFETQNEPRNDGNKQSELRAELVEYGKNSTYRPDAPSRSDLRGSGKQVPSVVANTAFESDRSDLKAFVHDVYFEYLAFALRRNYLTFGFLQLFAFVLLCENHTVREAVDFEYVMIDEFQDTSEIQFELALLLAGTNNLCVVGDWKQSIYSFQYADVDNIVEFADRIDAFADSLNRDHERVTWSTEPVETVELTENYRSTQQILDFSEETLLTPAASRDSVDTDSVRENVVSLDAATDHDHTRIEAIQSSDEEEAILEKVQSIVGNDAYQVEDDDGNLRTPEYGDIAVVTRTRDFGRELLATAREYGLPMAYEGGIELFRTDQAKLLLAWLRILEDDSDRGWAVVLEDAGYTLDTVDTILDEATYPEDMAAFRDSLADMDTLAGVAQRVFDHYGYDDATADVVLQTVQSVHDTTTLTRGDLIRFVEDSIDAGSTHEVHAGEGTDSVTVQTIHATKGLEYPIVVLANMNQGAFPPRGGSDGTITYDEPVGLRQHDVYDADAYDYPHVYDNWRTDILQACLQRNYDEERRLLYVAVTRAESHVVFTASDRPNTFIEELPVDVETVEPDPDFVDAEDTSQSTFSVTLPDADGPTGYDPHTLMRDDVFEDVDAGRGTEFGTQVHDFAEAYADGEDVTPSNDDQRHVAAFLDGLDGELSVEVDARLPLTVDGDDVSISGVVDLVHVTDDEAVVVDYKTDRGRHGEPEYRKQVSVYYHVVDAVYPDRDVSARILYTEDGSLRAVEPMSREALAEVVRGVATDD